MTGNCMASRRTARVAALIGLLALIPVAADADELLVWLKGKDGFVPPGAVVAGRGQTGNLYICRTDIDGQLIPGTIINGNCEVVLNGRVKANYSYEVLVRKLGRSRDDAAQSPVNQRSSLSIYNKSGRSAGVEVTDRDGASHSADLKPEGTLRLGLNCPCEITEMDSPRSLTPYRHAGGTLVLDWTGSSYRSR